MTMKGYGLRSDNRSGLSSTYFIGADRVVSWPVAEAVACCCYGQTLFA